MPYTDVHIATAIGDPRPCARKWRSGSARVARDDEAVIVEPSSTGVCLKGSTICTRTSHSFYLNAMLCCTNFPRLSESASVSYLKNREVKIRWWY